MDKIKATAVGYGITEEFAQALHNFVDECLAVAEKKHKASHADTAWTIAMEGLAAHYTAKCEALQAECDKKDARIAKLRETVKVLEVNLSELAKRTLPSKDTHVMLLQGTIESLESSNSKKQARIFELSESYNQHQRELAALRQRLADSENTVAQLRAARDKRTSKTDGGNTSLNRMAQNTELIKVEPPSVGSKSHPPGNDGVTHYSKGVWIDWHGGNEAPIPDGVWFKVKLRCGEIGEDDEASTWVWSYGRVGVSGDIIAFMIL